MQVSIIHCDCCKNPMKEENDNGIQGQLVKPGIEALKTPPEDVPIDMDDLCDGCAADLNELIEDLVIKKRVNA